MCILTPKYYIEVKDTIYMKILARQGDFIPKIGLFLMELRRQMQLFFSRAAREMIKNYLEANMETRVAVISIIVENSEAVHEVNEILHTYGEHIIGRMGIPYRQKGINIISIAIDAPQDVISALSGKIGKLKGVSSKAAYSNVGAK